MRISDWSSDVCSSDLRLHHAQGSSFGWLRPRSRKLPVAIPPPRLTRERAFWRSRCRIDENGPQTAFGPDVAAYVCGTCADRIIRYDRYHYRSEERRVGKECVGTCRSRRLQLN